MTSATGVAPRFSACSSDSTTTTPPPSPRTNPSRVTSNGREADSGSSLRFDKAPMFASAAMPIGTTGASDPPVRTTSHSPDRMSRSASWNAMTDVAHAATWVMTGPVSPHSIESSAAPIEPDSAGIANGRHEPWTLRVVGVGPVDDRLDPAAAGVDDDADAIALLLAHRPEVDPAVGDGLLAGGHREVDEPASSGGPSWGPWPSSGRSRGPRRRSAPRSRRRRSSGSAGCRSRRRRGSPSTSGSRSRWA